MSRTPEAYDLMLWTLRRVWDSHCFAVRLKQPGLGAMLSHRVQLAIKIGETVSPDTQRKLLEESRS